jgi:hypothetical protein
MITDMTEGSIDPSLAWTGSEFGATWRDTRIADNEEIYFARISAIGTRIGSDIRITNDLGDSLDPVISWTGDSYYIAWDDARRPTSDIYFVKVAPDGSRGGDDIQITDTSFTSRRTDAVWTGSRFGLTWQENVDGTSYEIMFNLIGFCE